MMTYRVEGMTCGGCEASLRRLLENAGVTVAALSHAEATLSVQGLHDPDLVARVVSAAGFAFEGPAKPSGA